jgi:hypothetical protein
LVPSNFNVRLAFVLLAALPVTTVAADTSSRPRKYEPPTGFAGHPWGELRTRFDGLPQEPLGVAAAYMLAKEKDVWVTCTLGCDFQDALLRIGRSYEGGGFYVLSEYVVPEQGVRMGGETNGVTFHPVVYQFCANWHSSVRKKRAPPNFDDINQFCGMRLQFQSESRAQLAQLPADQVTVYDHVLKLLIARFGEPANHQRRGKVLIETEEGTTANASERKFAIYRWCPADIDGFHTKCKASVLLSINPATGLGTVLYSAPALWEYAYARDVNHKGDGLYKLLQAKQ